MTSHPHSIEQALSAIEVKDYLKAFTILSALAEGGHPKAQLNLATLFQFGWGTDPDGKKAAELYETVGAMGITEEHISAIAYNNLATLYFVGAPGISQDAEKGLKYRRLCKNLGFEM